MSDISIVIPTRNRHLFLKQTVQEILNISHGNEIIIVDNSDSILRHDFVIGSNQLKYIHSSDTLSVTGNFEKAISLPSRKYVTFIGDDDLISPKFDEIVNYLDDGKFESLYPWNNGYISHFIWPGVITNSGILYMRAFDSKVTEYLPQNSIDNAIRFPGKGPANLPKIYQGIVSQDLIKKTRSKYGQIFGGVSPDIYSGITLASCSKKIASINYPFIIPGASALSTAGEGFVKSDRDKVKSNKDHIKRFGEALDWPDIIPDVYTSHTVWALSLYAAANKIALKTPRKYLAFLYIEMLIKYPEFQQEIRKSFRAANLSSIQQIQLFINGLGSYIGYYLPRISNRIFHQENKFSEIEFSNISEIALNVK
jgi:glycosyltransferase involved in cell wall biosynthesis